MKTPITATTLLLALANAHCGHSAQPAARDASPEAADAALDAVARDVLPETATDGAPPDLTLESDHPGDPDPCDMDGDGNRSGAPGCSVGTMIPDCDDRDRSRYIGNVEVADEAGHDEDCNPCTVAPASSDGDGDTALDRRYFNRWNATGERPRCERTAGVEVCPDAANPRCGAGAEAVVRGADCNDDPALGGRSARPGEREQCDGIDNDCDGLTDNVPTTGTDESCTMGSPDEPCYDAACGGRAGTRACVNCIRTACQASLPRCAPGERQACAIPGIACPGHRVCNASCQFAACAVDAEVCNYRDDNCDGRVDEGLGRTCDQTFQRGVARALDLTAEWTPVYEASADTTTDAITLVDGARALGAATVRTPFPLAGDLLVTGQVLIGNVETVAGHAWRGDLEVYVTTQPPSGTGPAVEFPAGTRGYKAFANLLSPQNPNSAQLSAIDADGVTLLRSGILAGDIVGFNVGGVQASTMPHRNDFRLQLRNGGLTFGVVWTGYPMPLNSAADPRGAALLGQPVYVTVAVIDGTRRTYAQLVRVDLHRGAVEPSGGPCADSTPPEPYCPR